MAPLSMYCLRLCNSSERSRTHLGEAQSIAFLRGGGYEQAGSSDASTKRKVAVVCLSDDAAALIKRSVPTVPQRKRVGFITTAAAAAAAADIMRLKGVSREWDWDLAVALKNFELEGAREEMESMTPSTSHDKVSGLGECASRKLPTPGYAFCLPDLERLAPDFRNFLEKDLIETPTQKRLEASKHLNWWHQYGQKLYPLSTTGDGNCLLHAASLGMWGLHDRQLTLREALYEMLKRGSRRSALWRRWKWAEHHANQVLLSCGYVTYLM
ncbi:hypothetical protein OSTOST_00955 [Ostertagia ostertagi]